MFDKIDGKAQIFIAQPIPPYAAGDLWVTSTENGKAAVKICKTARSSGAYSADDWIDTKYIDKSQVDSAINAYDTSLGQSEVFNKLTNGGKDQGLFVQNGKLYINADYILAGLLAGEFINAKGIKVLDKSGNTTFYIDDSGNVTLRVTSFSLEGNSIQSIANSAANSYASSALSSAKTYTDKAIANIDVNLSQQEVFNILTNNGQTQGIYLSGGRIYINASYIDTGRLAGWTVNYSSLYCKVGYNSVTLDAGNGRVRTECDTEIFGGLGYAEMSGYTMRADVMETMDFKAKSGGTAQFYGTTKVYNLKHVSSGGHLVFASDGSTLAYLSSSSRRYKDHIRRVELPDVQSLYKLPVVYFKYRDGYLDNNDRLVGKPIPGFYAENVRMLYPDGVRYDADGYAEDWNERTLIPAMLKLIQEQKKQIDILETTTQEQSNKIASLEERISKLEQLIGGECLGN